MTTTNHAPVTFETVLAQLETLLASVKDATEECKGKTLPQAIKVYWRLKQKYTELDNLRKGVYKELEFLERSLLPAKFDDAELDLVRIPELERSFYPNTKYSAKQKDKEGLMQWLRDNDHGDVITEQVNASTLAGLLKSLMLEEGIEVDPEIAELTTYKLIGSSKYTPKEK